MTQQLNFLLTLRRERFAAKNFINLLSTILSNWFFNVIQNTYICILKYIVMEVCNVFEEVNKCIFFFFSTKNFHKFLLSILGCGKRIHGLQMNNRTYPYLLPLCEKNCLKIFTLLTETVVKQKVTRSEAGSQLPAQTISQLQI